MITRQPKIIVVGAGIAGLSSASQLAKAGFTDVLVLEASDRIGGRIHTVPFGDDPSPVELGANWIHGATLQNSTFQLAENASVLNPYRIVNRMNARFMREVGTEIDREVVSKTWYIVKRIFVGLAKELPNEVSKNKAGISFEAVIEKNIKEELQNEFREKSTIADARKVLNAMKNYMRFHEGDELNMVSFENEYLEYEGGDIHIPGGYVQILQHLLKIIPKQSVKFQSEVTKIRWKNGTDNRVEIVVKDGTQYYADHVVLTVSLGYLKRNHVSLFEPSLPAEKVNAIDSIGFGRVNKIFLEFDRAITKPSYKFIAFAWDHLDIQKDKSQWYKSLFGFDQLFTRDNTVLGWISGDAAVHMETLTDQLISDTCVKLLRKFLNDDSIPDPKNILVSRWCNDPYSLGAYSFPTPNMIPGSQTTLSQPVAPVPFGKPSVLFAGEATHTNHYSCTHGARDTGIREADRIIMMYTNESVNSKL